MNEYTWYESYKAVILETDWMKMSDRILIAKVKIIERRRVLSMDHGGTPEERQALEDAIDSLNTLGKKAAEWQGRQRNVSPPNSPSV